MAGGLTTDQLSLFPAPFVSDVKFAFFWVCRSSKGPMSVLPPMKMVLLAMTGPNFACFPT